MGNRINKNNYNIHQYIGEQKGHLMKNTKKYGKMNLRKNLSLFIIFTILLIVAIFGSIAVFNTQFKQQLHQHVVDHLDEISSPSMLSFKMQIEEQADKVKLIASTISTDFTELGSKEQLEFLDTVVEFNHLENCYILLNDGTVYSNDPTIKANPELFESFKEGETIRIYNPIVIDKESLTSVIPFTAPIYMNGEVVGKLVYSYLCDNFSRIFNLEFLSTMGEIIMIDSQGNQLFGESSYFSDNENVISFINRYCTTEECIDLNSMTNSLTLRHKDLSDPLVISFYKLDINDWYMIATVPEKVASLAFSNIFTLQQAFNFSVSGFIIIYFIVIIFLFFETDKRYDSLTGLYTASKFKKVAKKILEKNKVDYVFIKLDVRNFKLVNRILGNDIGDLVLVTIANELRKVLTGSETACAREGKDSFIFMLPYTNSSDLMDLRSQFIKNFTNSMGKKFKYNIEFPVGQFVVKSDDPERYNIESILEKINFAHGVSKYETGEKVIVDYQEDLENTVILTKKIEAEMMTALENDEFELYLQPKVSTEDESICGAEALVRWVKDGKVYRYPDEFIPIFEANGFITKVDYCIFEKTVKFLNKVKKDEGVLIPISVNFSRLHLVNENFVSDLCKITEKYNIPNEYLEIEVTESIVSENLDIIAKVITELHDAKFRIAVDDFGTAYSSLSMLKSLCFDATKMDKGFFDDAGLKTRGKIVISNVMSMAKELDSVTVAEGIEEQQQVDMLKDVDCDMIQGYYYYKPMNVEDFEKALASHEENRNEEMKNDEKS